MEVTKTFEINVADLKVEPDEVLRILGYSKSSAPEPVIENTRRYLSMISQIVTPMGGSFIWNDVRSELFENSFSIGKTNFNAGKIIASQLEGSEYFAGIVATAGSKVSELSMELTATGDFLAGYIVDAIGSVVAEIAADFVQNQLESILSAQKFSLTNRLSPGYCGWDVSEQHKLFALLPDNFCGVKLTESSLMIPIKSISAIVGIGKNVNKGAHPCSVCRVEKCNSRK
jgi:hypothetical protein